MPTRERRAKSLGVPVDELPPKIGLIYVDLENFAYIRSSETIFGVQVVKRASKRLDGVLSVMRPPSCCPRTLRGRDVIG